MVVAVAVVRLCFKYYTLFIARPGRVRVANVLLAIQTGGRAHEEPACGFRYIRYKFVDNQSRHPYGSRTRSGYNG